MEGNIDEFSALAGRGGQGEIGTVSHILQVAFQELYPKEVPSKVDEPPVEKEGEEAEEAKPTTEEVSSGEVDKAEDGGHDSEAEEHQQSPQETKEDEEWGARLAAIEDDLNISLEGSKRATKHLLQSLEQAEEEDKRAAAAMEEEFLGSSKVLPLGPSRLSVDKSIFDQESLINPKSIENDHAEHIKKLNSTLQARPSSASMSATALVEGASGYLKSTVSFSSKIAARKEAFEKEQTMFAPVRLEPNDNGEETGDDNVVNSGMENVVRKMKRRRKATSGGKHGKGDRTESDLLAKLLGRLADRSRFLKNPRYQKAATSVSLRDAFLKSSKIAETLNKRDAENAVGMKETGTTRSSARGQGFRIATTNGRNKEPRLQGETSLSFRAEPDVLVYGEYESGTVYERSLNIRNVSNVSRRLRILPPKTSAFALSVAKFPKFEGETMQDMLSTSSSFGSMKTMGADGGAPATGTIAPGMYCQVVVRFAPDSLADYDDLVTVVAEDGSVFPIRLQGRRPPPILTLPHNLDTGVCLIGAHKVTTFTCTNLGGRGRFILIPEESWPEIPSVVLFDEFLQAGESEEKVNDSDEMNESRGVLRAGSALSMLSRDDADTYGVAAKPFIISPSEFELDEGESVDIRVGYVPTGHRGESLDRPGELLEDSVTIQMVCDNCQVKSFTITGLPAMPMLELTLVDGRKALGEKAFDSSAWKPDKTKKNDILKVVKRNVDSSVSFVEGSTIIDTDQEAEDDVGLRPVVPIPIKEYHEGALSGFPIPLERLVFQELAVGAETKRTITIRNIIGHEVRYRWETIALAIDKDLPAPAYDALAESSIKRRSKGESLTLEGEASTAFTISPAEGVFAAEEEQVFEVTFHPSAVGAVTSLARIVVEEVPKLSVFRQRVEDSFDEHAQDGEDIRGTTDASMMSIRFDGTGIPRKVHLEPKYIPLGSSLVSGKSITRNITIVNKTVARTPFRFVVPSASTQGRLRPGKSGRDSTTNESNVFVEITPKEGVLEPKEELTVTVLATGQVNSSSSLHRKAQQYHHELKITCEVENGENIDVVMEGSIRGPTLVIEDTSLNFGLVRLNKPNSVFGAINAPVSIPLRIRNMGPCSATWTLGCTAGVLGTETAAKGFKAPRAIDDGEVEFSPSSGELDAGEVATVDVILRPQTVGSIRGGLLCTVSDGGLSSVVPIKAEVVEPKLCVTPPQLDLGTCYVSVPITRTVTLRNLTLHPTVFNFSHDDNDIFFEKDMVPQENYSAYSSQESAISVEYYPQKGHLDPMEEKEIEVTVLFRRPGQLSAFTVGYAEGMARPLTLNVLGFVEDLRVSFKVLDSNGVEMPMEPEARDGVSATAAYQDGVLVPKIDFGSKLPILKPVTRTLVITNETNIPTMYALEVKSFSGMIPDESIVTALTTSLGLDASKLGQENMLTAAVKDNLSQRPENNGKGQATAEDAVKAGLDSIAQSLGTSRAFAEGLMGTLSSTLGGIKSGTGPSTGSARRRKVLLSDDNEKARPYNSIGGQTHIAQRNLDRLQRAILATGKGAAFVPSPELGDIAPFSSVEVPVTLYTDAAGTYVDQLTVSVGHLRPFEVALRADVLGSPLELLGHTMGLNFVEKNDKDATSGLSLVSDGNGTGESEIEAALDFGSYLRGKKLVSRKIKVANRGRSDALLQWKIFRETTVRNTPVLTLKLKNESEGLVFADELSSRSIDNPVLENAVGLRIKPKVPQDIVEEILHARNSGEEEPEQAFFMHPPEAVIPPYSEASFTISFKSLQAGNHEYRLIGCVTLLEENIKAAAAEDKLLKTVKTQALDPRPGTKFTLYPQEEPLADGARMKVVKEVTGVHAPPLVVACKALTTRASLATGDRVRLAFHAHAPSPLDSEEYCKNITLTNHTEASLEFAFEIDGSFSIVDTNTAAPAHPLAIRDTVLSASMSPRSISATNGRSTPRGPTLIFALPPRASVTARVRFEPSTRKPPSRENARPLVERGNLKVVYGNEDQQLFPLDGVLVYPILFPLEGLKKVRGGYLLDFGEIHVDTPKTHSFVLRNSTASDATFKVTPLAPPKAGTITAPADMIKRGAFGEPAVEAKRSSSDPAVFEFSQNHGKVEGSKLYPKDAPMTITFKPKSKDSYECRFRVQVAYGCGFDVTLRGKGSYDEERDVKHTY